jgi:hypothetical protein
MAAENAGNWPQRRDRTATLGIFAVDGPLLPVTLRHISDILILGLISGMGFPVRYSDCRKNAFPDRMI